MDSIDLKKCKLIFSLKISDFMWKKSQKLKDFDSDNVFGSTGHRLIDRDYSLVPQDR